MSEATVDTTKLPEVEIINLRPPAEKRRRERRKPPRTEPIKAVTDRILNAFGRFTEGVVHLRLQAGHSRFSRQDVARIAGAAVAQLSRSSYDEAKAIISYAKARAYVVRIVASERHVPGFRDFWKTQRPGVRAWIASRAPKPAPEETHPYRLFLRDIVRENGLNDANDLREIPELENVDFKNMPLRRPRTKRILYILAERFPLPYATRKPMLDQWVETLDPLGTRNKKVPDSRIGAITRLIMDRTHEEKGLTGERIAELYGMAQPPFIQTFLQADPPRQMAAKVGFILSQHASRHAWLESAADFYTAALDLRDAPPKIEPDGIRPLPPSKYESLDALKHRIQDDWRGAALEVMHVAAALRPDLAPDVPTYEWHESWRRLLGCSPDNPRQASLDECRRVLKVVRRQFADARERLLLPVHLHNKPGRDLRKDEISSQIDWLLKLEIP